MKQNFLFVSLLAVILFACTSCAHNLTESKASLPPIIRVDTTSQRYNLQFDFMKHHFSGLFIVRRLPNDEIRMLASTYFGLSLFDFSLRNDTFVVNSCIEPMRNEKILRLLEADFKNLFLAKNNLRTVKKRPGFEKRAGGRGFGKSIFFLSTEGAERAQHIEIRHPWLRLKMQLDELPPH